MHENVHIGISIVNFEKGTQTLENILGILRQQGNFRLSVVVWDNPGKHPENNGERLFQAFSHRFSHQKSSEEKTYTLHQFETEKSVKIFLVQSSKNVGYTRANNESVKILEQTPLHFLALVNPDIGWTHADTLEKMKFFLEKNSEIGVLGPLQRLENGNRESSIRRFPQFFRQILRRSGFFHWLKQEKFFDEYENIISEITEVDWIQSSFWFLPFSVWKKENGLDERFFLFLADTDFCRRVQNDGKKIVFFPKTEVSCDGIRCSQGNLLSFFFKKTVQIHAMDMVKYFLKWKKN